MLTRNLPFRHGDLVCFVASGVLLTGGAVNTLTINPVSGSGGDGFL